MSDRAKRCAACGEPSHHYGYGDPQHRYDPTACINSLLYHIERLEADVQHAYDRLDARYAEPYI